MSAGRPYRALRHRDFRRLAVALFVSYLGAQMQLVAVDWHLWILTRSPLALGLVGLVRVVPIVAFSLWGGLAADTWDRRKVLFAARATQALAAVGLATVTLLGAARPGWIYAFTGLSAAATAFDAPARQALIPRLVPLEELPGALAITLSGLQLAAIGGPALAGAVLAAAAGTTGGVGWIYATNALAFTLILATIPTLRPREPETRTASPPPVRAVAAMKEGLVFVFRTPLLVWTMSLDFFATLFAGSISLLPVFADHVLNVGAAGFGWLRAAPGAGALVASATSAFMPLPRKQGRLLLLSVGVYGVATVVFGLSRSFALTVAALALVGFSDTVSTVVRQTLRQLVTPDALRGRMTGVNMVFFMGGPQLGELEAGLVASIFASAATGATVAVVTGGVATLLVVALVAWKAGIVRDYEPGTLPAVRP